MGERLTAITIPGSAGLADHGRQSVPAMIASIRSHAEHMRKEADVILSAADADFHVETYVGAYARRNIFVLQQGRDK